MRKPILLAIVMMVACGVLVDAQRTRARRVRPVPPLTHGCNGACIYDQTFPTSTFTQNASVIKSGGGPCSGYAVTVDTLSADVKTAENDPEVGPCSAVTDVANYSGGGGGRGIYHRRELGDNVLSGGVLKIIFPSVSVFHFSYVMSYTAGFEFNSGTNPTYTKDWYSGAIPSFIIFGHQGGAWGFNINGATNHPGSNAFGASIYDWNTMYPGAGHVADTAWHCMDNYIDFAGGRAVMWVDGQKILDESSVDFAGRTTLTELRNNNQHLVTVAGATLFDDIKIDDDLVGGPSVRIGCPGFN